jgi:hypothetical protein
MTVLAFASSDADPFNNPGIPAEVDLASVTPPTTVQLYGAGQDTANPSATFTYAWEIVAQGVVSGVPAATLDDATLQNPTLTVEGWGNVLLLLVVTSNTGGASEANPRQAPRASRVVVQVLGADRGLQVVAAGERDWFPALDEAIAQLEAIATGVPPHDIADHTDAGALTGTNLNRQIAGSYAGTGTWPGSWTADHRHRGSDVDVAETSQRGTAKLRDTPRDPVDPRVLNWQSDTLTQAVDRTRTALSFVNVIQPNPAASLTGPLDVHCLFKPAPLGFRPWEVVRWDVVLLDGGLAVPVKQYVFELIRGTAAEIQAGTYTILDTLTGAPSTDNAGLFLFNEAVFPGANLGEVTDKDQFLAVRVNDGDGGGRQMRVTVNLVRRA